MFNRIITQSKIVLLMAAFLTLPFLADRPFYTRGEGREALVAQSIIERGEWLVGVGYGGVVPSKPPLMHWFAALFSLPQGYVNEFTARLPSALSAILLAWFFSRFITERKGHNLGALTGLILISSVEFFRAATVCRVDMMLTALIGIALVELYRWYENGFTSIPLVAILALSGATLTKGPVGFVLPGAIFVFFLLWQKVSLSKIVMNCLKVFPLVVCIAGIWYGIAYVERGDEFIKKVYYENFARLTGTQEDSPHRHSVIYLFGMLVLGMLPWSAMLIPAMKLSSLRDYIKNRWLPNDGLSRYLLLWSGIFILFFSIPSGKRSVYLLPMYPAIAYFMASFYAAVPLIYIKKCFNILASLIFSILLLTSLGVILPSLTYQLPSAQFFSALFTSLWCSWDSISTWVLYALFMLLTLVVTRRIKLTTHASYAVMCIVIMAGVSGSLAAKFANEVSVYNFSENVQNDLVSVNKLYSYENEFYPLSFYLRRQITRLESSPIVGSVVFLYEDNLEKLRTILASGSELEFLARSRGYVEKVDSKLIAVKIVERS